MLFNDPVNTREYVSRILMGSIGLTEGEAYQAMMQAHEFGMAVVGTFPFEPAEGYVSQMRQGGLTADMKPADD